MNKLALVAAFFVTIIAFFLLSDFKPSMETALVARVIDGDTFEIESGDEVRILGINTPERDQPLYENATSFLKGLIEGKNVSMERDAVSTDKYGRRLRYVFTGNTFVNEEMLKSGFANVYIIPPNEKYSARLRRAEEYAKENILGLWKSSYHSKCISVSEFHWDAAGNDAENLNDEYVSLANACNYSVNMGGWSLKDSGTSTYKFKNFSIEPNQQVRIRSGCGANTEKELFWCSKRAIWNNDGDSLFLQDTQELLVLSESYEGRDA